MRHHVPQLISRMSIDAHSRDFYLLLSSNRLSLNPHQTQIIWFDTPQRRLKLELPLLTERFSSFVFHSSVRNLGVVLDSTLTFSEHVGNLTRSSYFHLRRLRSGPSPLIIYLHCPCLHLLSNRLLQFSPGWSSKGFSYSSSACSKY